MRDKISVIIPVYNGENYIAHCVEQLTGQTYDNLECILIDDASGDRTWELLVKYQEQYPSLLKVIHLEENLGPGGARNRGLDAATGEYIGFVDCDDDFSAELYEELYQAAREEDLDIVECRYCSEIDGNQIEQTFTAESTGDLDEKKKEILIAKSGGYLWSKLIRSALIQETHCRFREHVFCEDADFLMYVITAAKRAGVVENVLYYYRNHEESATRSGNPQGEVEQLISLIGAVHKRLNPLACYAGIKDGAEYYMLRRYFMAAAVCLMNQDTEGFLLAENIRKLKKCRQLYFPYTEQNKFLDLLTDDEKDIITWFDGISL